MARPIQAQWVPPFCIEGARCGDFFRQYERMSKNEPPMGGSFFLRRAGPAAPRGGNGRGRGARAPRIRRQRSPFRCQMSSAYSRMVLSEEKKPIRAVLFMAILAQRLLSRKASSTLLWTSQYDW